jgi:integrase
VFLPWVKAEKEASTYTSYRNYYRAYLEPHFNHTKTLRGYESYMGTNLLEQLASKFSENTVSHARALASSIFSYATAKGYIKYNPWRDVKKTTAGQDVEDGYAYNEREIEDILAALERVAGREDRSAELAGMLVTLCFFGGLRPSEAAGLKWKDVNFTDARIKIQSAFVQGNLKGTKTGKIRTIVMLPQLLHRLKLWALREGYPTAGFVFQNRDGNPVNVNDLSARIIGPTLKKVDMEWQGFYAARRGFGTMMVLVGCTLDEVADAMGNSPDVVFRHYFKDKDSKLAAKGFAKLASAMAGQREQKTLTAGGEQ